ncbi:hypothetical protein [Mycobacterium sp. shizuoka-1]|uniref:hypothetical protein n=1 Tax=Mycobacterium sp. shizuoka-1 TaxID=2039281 RepID=UPI001157110D|nr:hypothetical protein [Mycobacterium sp. shizuoka-1]
MGRRPLRAGAVGVSLALAAMVVAATEPQTVSTPVVGLAGLVFPDATVHPAADAIVEFFDYKILPADRDSALLSIGGPDDAATLAELLDSTAPSTNVFHVNYEFDADAKVQVLNVFTDANALNTHDSTKSVDPSGGVNCTGATICHTDPRTHTTTLTYPDGVVAVVERINDLAVVAYRSLGAAVLGHLDPLPPAEPAPEPASVPASPAPDPAPADEPAGAPAAPAASVGPRLNVMRPAPDFTPGRPAAPSSSGGAKPALADTTEKFVTNVLTQVSDTVNRLFKRDGARSGVGKPSTPAPTADE